MRAQRLTASEVKTGATGTNSLPTGGGAQRLTASEVKTENTASFIICRVQVLNALRHQR